MPLSAIMNFMKLTFLGTGTSHGVPVIACNCTVCKSTDPHNRRGRSSAYVQTQDADGNSKFLLIDIGPDFREQAIRENIQKIDAVLLTHAHADHLFGIDDLRSFSCIMSNKPDNPQNEKYNNPPIPIYTNKTATGIVRQSFGYLFSEIADGGGHAKIKLIESTSQFSIGQTTITPVPMMHGHMETTGWLLTENSSGNTAGDTTDDTTEGPRSIAYLTDCNFISEESIELIHKNCHPEQGGRLVHLVIDGLRIKEHSTHFNFLQALEAASKIGGEHIWFTHLTHNSSHEETAAYLAEHRAEFPGLATALSILPAYDGLVIEV